jgi:hypothetical protein
MTDPTSALLEYLRQVGAGLDPDFLREAVRVMSALLMEIEVKQQIGADRYERTEERTTYRNGYRDRAWQTRVGEVPLNIPKLREGSYFPSLLEPRRQAEQALLSVIQQAYIQGVSTRRVDERGLCSGFDQHRQEYCLAHQPAIGYDGAPVSGTEVGRHLPLCLAGCAVPQSATEPPHCQPGGGHCHWGQRNSPCGKSWALTLARVKNTPFSWPFSAV